jgi:hypothetical protein
MRDLLNTTLSTKPFSKHCTLNNYFAIRENLRKEKFGKFSFPLKVLIYIGRLESGSITLARKK